MNVIAESATEILRQNPGEKWTTEKVLSIRYWTSTLLSFRTTRNRDFRFTPGHYARLGLGFGDDTVWRPFSMVSAAGDDYLEFIAVLVPGGAFSEQLGRLRVGDEVKIEKSSYGFLTVDQLAPGRDLWLLASGTGIGPFLSILRDPLPWRTFEQLIVVHSVRHSAELVYRDEIAAIPNEALLTGGGARLSYLPVITREPGASPLADRIPRLLAAGRLEQSAGVPLSVADSRLMICGNPELARELRQLLSSRSFASSRRGVSGQMAFEKYW
ncbi:Ferredoxin--NADP(+) reductase [Georgfuchsia toluolica]|uniref:ferredoxin--NADP(+) reductase n=1 Tax=Georgfuchsia toluolica TaxID=424218 RepID=A0A916N227_9PROT|nr:ferredoxin--NADP reductase [Georgfuchsia toluolica]CAG4883359.1 Ferredoxin--NADP(+) reductase [Georgfuchsia toluolica]